MEVVQEPTAAQAVPIAEKVCPWPKGDRVCLKIEIPWTDHSFIIGTGYAIQDLMRETKCHIHFPDCNRFLGAEKSNQVVIAGKIDAIDNARQRLRSMTPVVVTVHLTENMITDLRGAKAKITGFAKNHQVEVFFKPEEGDAKFVIIRSTKERIDKAQSFLDEFCQFLTVCPSSVNLHTILDVAPKHQPALLRHQQEIMRETATVVIAPNLQDQNLPILRRSQLQIFGSTIQAAFRARELFVSHFPVLLLLDLANKGFDTAPNTVRKLGRIFDVSVRHCREAALRIPSLGIIEGKEGKMENIYQAQKCWASTCHQAPYRLLPTSPCV